MKKYKLKGCHILPLSQNEDCLLYSAYNPLKIAEAVAFKVMHDIVSDNIILAIGLSEKEKDRYFIMVTEEQLELCFIEVKE